MVKSRNQGVRGRDVQSVKSADIFRIIEGNSHLLEDRLTDANYDAIMHAADVIADDPYSIRMHLSIVAVIYDVLKRSLKNTQKVSFSTMKSELKSLYDATQRFRVAMSGLSPETMALLDHCDDIVLSEIDKGRTDIGNSTFGHPIHQQNPDDDTSAVSFPTV